MCDSTRLDTCQHHSKQVAPRRCIAHIIKPIHTGEAINKTSRKLSRGTDGGAAAMGINGSTHISLPFVYSHAAWQIQLSYRSLQYHFARSFVAFKLQCCDEFCIYFDCINSSPLKFHYVHNCVVMLPFVVTWADGQSLLSKMFSRKFKLWDISKLHSGGAPHGGSR